MGLRSKTAFGNRPESHEIPSGSDTARADYQTILRIRKGCRGSTGPSLPQFLTLCIFGGDTRRRTRASVGVQRLLPTIAPLEVPLEGSPVFFTDPG